jgi:hypothetical protein
VQARFCRFSGGRISERPSPDYGKESGGHFESNRPMQSYTVHKSHLRVGLVRASRLGRQEITSKRARFQ